MLAKDLLLLGVIRRGEISGYALARTVRSHALLHPDFARGNVLYRLRTMQDEGLIRSRTDARASGPHGRRTMYALTEAGEARFHEMLARAFAYEGPGNADVEVALVLAGDAPNAQLDAFLQSRLDGIARYERKLARVFRGARGDGMGAAHLRGAVVAERAWVVAALADLRKRSP